MRVLPRYLSATAIAPHVVEAREEAPENGAAAQINDRVELETFEMQAKARPGSKLIRRMHSPTPFAYSTLPRLGEGQFQIEWAMIFSRQVYPNRLAVTAELKLEYVAMH